MRSESDLEERIPLRVFHVAADRAEGTGLRHNPQRTDEPLFRTWASHLTALGLIFLTWKMGETAVALLGVVVRNGSFTSRLLNSYYVHIDSEDTAANKAQEILAVVL